MVNNIWELHILDDYYTSVVSFFRRRIFDPDGKKAKHLQEKEG